MLEWVTTVKKVFEDHGMDLYCDIFLSHRAAVYLSMLCYDKTDPLQRARTDKIYDALFEEGKKRGFAKYRTHLNHMGESKLDSTQSLYAGLLTWLLHRTICRHDGLQQPCLPQVRGNTQGMHTVAISTVQRR